MVKNLKVNYSRNIELDKKIVHNLISFLKKELKFDVSSLIINFISSNLITKINIQYLGHQYSTDIITFNYSGSHQFLDGELFISFEDAAVNAAKYSAPLREEYIRLIIHGILHLLDYDDQNKNAKLVMKRLENKMLKSYKIDYLRQRN